MNFSRKLEVRDDSSSDSADSSHGIWGCDSGCHNLGGAQGGSVSVDEARLASTHR